MAEKIKKEKRPPIPEAIKLRIWVLAAGRCEFPGCNELLIRDRLTLTPGNFSNISHIISWTPSGPRGDAKLSSKLAKDFSNLMLMCQPHGKQIDIKENLSIYTVDFLRQCKEAHEQRIKMQTEIDISRKTTTIRIQSNIRGRKVEVPHTEVYTALINAGRYPEEEKGVLIDLTGIDYSQEKDFWGTTTKHIDNVLGRLLTVGNDGQKNYHLSVFGIAPIPALAYLGFKLGNTIPADIYIKRREKPWLINSAPSNLAFLVDAKNVDGHPENIGLVIAISGAGISELEMSKHLSADAPMYKIKITEPGLDVIQSVEDLEAFRVVYRKTIDKIREKHGKKSVIHLFGAMPTSTAIVCGRELLHGVDPKMAIYEHMGDQEGFVQAITIN